MRPQYFDLNHEYAKAPLESTHYSPSTGTLAPKEIRGYSVTAPLELALDPDKAAFFKGVPETMAKALNIAIKAVKDGAIAKNTIFYNPRLVNMVQSPRIGEILFIVYCLFQYMR